MKQVIDLYRSLLGKTDHQVMSENRTGIDTIATFGHQMRFNMADGYPLMTTRKIFIKGIFEELRWILKGQTNVKPLQDVGVSFWNQWADDNGDLGPVYGAMWRRWPGINGETIDQLKKLIVDLKSNPKSRRHIITAWNPAFVPEDGKSFSENVGNGKQALPPCHCFFQFSARKLSSIDLARFIKLQTHRYNALCTEIKILEENLVDEFGKGHDASKLNEIVSAFSKRRKRVEGLLDTLSDTSVVTEDGVDKTVRTIKTFTETDMPEYGLSLLLYMRSNDTPIGLPTNIASYAALLQLVALECNMMVEDYVHVTGDTHIYENQIEGVKTQVQRQPRELPILDIELNYVHDPKSLDDENFFYNHLENIKFEVYGYKPHPVIKFPQAAL